MGVEPLAGNAVFIKKLETMEARCLNFLPALEECDRLFLAYEENKFADEGPGWAPLSPQTEARKVGLSDEMLVRGEPGHTEGLKLSLTTHEDGSLFQITPLSLREGTSVSYAHFHQDGDGDRMPARKLLDLETAAGAKMVVAWFKVLQRYFVNGVI